MASGPTVGEGDGVREKQRYVESKVYTRKAFKGLRKNNNNNTNSIADVVTAVTSAVENKQYNDNSRNKETSTAPTITAAANDIDDASASSHVNHDNDNDLPQPLPCTTVTEDENPTQKQLISRFDVASDDSSCLNREQVAAGDAVQSTRDQSSGNGVVEKAVENENNNNLASRSKQEKQEVRELRHKLESELEIIRNVLKRIEAKQRELSESSNFHGSANEGMNKVAGDKQIHPEVAGDKQIHPEVAAIAVPREPSRPLNQLSISVLENSQGVSDYVEKEKRTPKANQFYRNSEFILGKDKLPPAESNKKAKTNIKKPGGGETIHGFGPGSKFFKSCSSLLDKLIKHKYGWVFDAPVDVQSLGLHDYYTIIKHPMDLGTVKSKLNKNWYKSPKEFAEDVRLTFHNAMTYNPKGQDVHVMAEQLLTIFEDRWVIIESDYNREMRFGLDYGAALSMPTSRKSRLPPPPPLDMRRILERSESTTYRLDSKSKPLSSTPSARTPAPKKPKAKDPHKRDMTYEEKQKLSNNLQNLPSEKLDAILQIIKKRNSDIFQDDEEIEVDIDSVDAETLWELDRFVTNYKKSLSKNKRKAELALQARADDEHNIAQKGHAVTEVPKETKADDNIVSSSVPVQGQGNSRSRSSSSSSSSSGSGSSSSDSDSESSSASGSDNGS
ncbi:transcription factor GTE4-like isoform X3 [Cucurbita maxima]|uniref:Transcription factor GTE4-like isoform X2 n=1 Tax=Cucurbita maxima TaxID=3661 RepID=A0A6J1JP69_CUCMA|nr:transcription factor GTE4-like isoform X2 [Cucurbita maxima]XP_022989074.1 transcription factor GTE4-like isoform X3 [Cucurbita maxima]